MKLPNETPKSKAKAVAEYICNIAEKNNAQYKANNVRTAYELAELLAEMTTTYETKHVNNFAVLMQEARSEGDMPTVEAWTYICMVTNWLSWAWAENNEPELSEAWGKEWHKINKFSLENLKGSDLKYYLEKTD